MVEEATLQWRAENWVPLRITGKSCPMQACYLLRIIIGKPKMFLGNSVFIISWANGRNEFCPMNPTFPLTWTSLDFLLWCPAFPKTKSWSDTVLWKKQTVCLNSVKLPNFGICLTVHNRNYWWNCFIFIRLCADSPKCLLHLHCLWHSSGRSFAHMYI